MDGKPWDARIARALISPLARTPVHPNHITTLGLAIGFAAAWCYGRGPSGADLGGILFLVAGVVDHADGELARLSGKTSEFGHRYDRAVDLVVKTSLFLGMGVGLRDGPLGVWAIPMGLVAGLSLVAIFTLRGAMAQRRGNDVYRQPAFAGFELEDILYLIAPVTWLGLLSGFFSLASIGIPVFALWSALQWRRIRREDGQGAS